MTFEEWLKSEKGQNCLTPMQWNELPYFKNRLYWAYEAGLESGEHDARLQKTCEWYEEKLKELRSRNKSLSRELNALKKQSL